MLHVGDSAAGMLHVGDSAAGMLHVGDSAAGMLHVGDSAAGMLHVGDSAAGIPIGYSGFHAENALMEDVQFQIHFRTWRLTWRGSPGRSLVDISGHS